MLDVRCQEHLDEVRAFAASIGLADQLRKQLDFLSNYGNGGLPPDAPGRKENRCVLFKDFAPHSFTFSIFKADHTARDGYRYLMNGGLIFQSASCPADGSFPSLTVSLAEGDGWHVHT